MRLPIFNKTYCILNNTILLFNEKDYLVRSDRGLQATMECFVTEIFFDTTNPEARDFVWKKCKENNLDKGVTLFWLDEAGPEYTAADFDIYRYYEGSALECANVYPAMLIAPVTEAGVVAKSVYLPAGTKWTEVESNTAYEGGQTVTVKAPLELIPVFVKDGAEVIKYFTADNN